LGGDYGTPPRHRVPRLIDLRDGGCYDGLGGNNGEDLPLANTPAECADRIEWLTVNETKPGEMARRARAFVEQEHE
jgi:hypothetical protein